MNTSIGNNALKISANTRGAELTSLVTLKDQTEWMWQADPKIWPRHAPILFPIVGKLENNRYKTDNGVYALSQHGFARDCEFTLVEEHPDSLFYQLRSDKQTLKQYPYQFELSVRYRLDHIKLDVEYSVKNTDHQMVWFSLGAHPGFNCPFNPGENFSDYILEFEMEEYAVRHFLEDGVFSGKTERVLDHSRYLPLTPDLFDRDAVIFKNLNSKKVSLRSKNGVRRISVSFDGFPYLGVWSKPGASFVCIEPWCGIADTKGSDRAFKDKEGILSLKPGEVFGRRYRITIE